MNRTQLHEKGERYLHAFCSVKPNRRTGSEGNREAVRYFADIIGQFGFSIDTTPFDCLDYVGRGVSLDGDGSNYEIHISPYSPPCDVAAELTVVSSIEELTKIDCRGKLLLLHGGICAEQLMPKNFPFYNPDHHKKIYSLLEEKQPAAIVTATAKNSELVGALYPYPLIYDGDFDVPNTFCTELTGDKIAACADRPFHLRIDAERIPVTASNVVASKNAKAEKKIVVTAHIDAYEDAPGATDNAAGTVVLLLLGELLEKYAGPLGIEIVAINGEDHYSAAGEKDYLERYGADFDRMVTVINIDDAGYVKGNTAYSFYEFPDALKKRAIGLFDTYTGLTEGEAWYNGDHMVFVQRGTPAIAFASEYMTELMRDATHTSRDTPDLVDCAKLGKLAQVLYDFILAVS